MIEAAVQWERWQCGKRGGNSTTSRRKRDVGATRDEAMQQPASTREAQCDMRDSGMTREGRVVRQGVAWQGGAQWRQGVVRWRRGVAWWGAARQWHKAALRGAAWQKAARHKLFKLRAFIDVTLFPKLPSVLLSCRPFVPFQHLDSVFQTSRALASCLSRHWLLNAMPSSNMQAPYNDNSAMKMPGQPLWPHPMWGNNESAPPTSLIPLLIPFAQPTKSILSNAAAILFMPLSVPPLWQLPCPLLPCRPLPLLSCHDTPRCHCLRCAARRCATPCHHRPAVLPLTVLPNTIIVTPFINATLLLVWPSVLPSCWLFHPSLKPPSFLWKTKFGSGKINFICRSNKVLFITIHRLNLPIYLYLKK
jgi:hypothetical protein